MNVGIAIFELLSNAADVAADVGNRIFPVTAAQSKTLPFITYDVITISPNDTKTGPSQVDEIDVEIVCHAATFASASAIQNNVRMALDRVPFQNDDVAVESFQFQTGSMEVVDSPRKYFAVLEFQAHVRRDSGAVYLGQPVAVTDGDGTIHQIQPGGTYQCIQNAPPTSQLPPPAAGHIYARIIPWDGLETFNETGSVEWHRAAGTYDYTLPVNPLNTAIRANGYFPNDAHSLLMFDNRFGNRYRWTNDLGEQFVEDFHKSASNNSQNPKMCFDHLTGLIVYVMRAQTERLDLTQSEWIEWANSLDYGGQSWRLADVSEFVGMFEYTDYVNAWGGAYTPFIDPWTRQYGGNFVFGNRTKDNQISYAVTNGPTFGYASNLASTFHHALIVANQYN